MGKRGRRHFVNHLHPQWVDRRSLHPLSTLGLGFSLKGNQEECDIEEGRSAFPKNMKMTPLKEKILIGAACVFGVSAVAYGTVLKNDIVFVIGIVVVIGAYLAIRRKLKAALREKTLS